MRNGTPDHPPGAATVLRRRPPGAPTPASYSQEWAWHLLGGAVSNRLNMPQVERLHGPLNVSALRRTLGEIARRHAVLRTHFRREGERLMQVIAPPRPLPMPLVDLCALPPARREAEMLRLAEAHARHPFDLSRGPLYIAQLLRLEPPGTPREQHVLCVNMHHILSDGWSLQVFAREFFLLYEAFSRGLPSPLPELPCQFADVAYWQRHPFQERALRDHMTWWLEKLGGELPRLELPQDHPEPEERGLAALTTTLSLPPAVSAGLREICRRAGCTVPMALVAAVKALLRHYSGQEDILVAWATAARDRPELMGLIGPFLNTVVLRTDLSGDPGFRELMLRVRRVSLEAYDHQDVPFPKLLRARFPNQRLTRTMLSRVLFNMLQFHGAAPSGGTPNSGTGSGAPPETALGGLRMETIPVGIEEQAKFDLTFSGMDRVDRVMLHITAAADIFEEGTLARLRDDLGRLLARAVEDPELGIRGLLR